jgi:hypothetical protein
MVGRLDDGDQIEAICFASVSFSSRDTLVGHCPCASMAELHPRPASRVRWWNTAVDITLGWRALRLTVSNIPRCSRGRHFWRVNTTGLALRKASGSPSNINPLLGRSRCSGRFDSSFPLLVIIIFFLNLSLSPISFSYFCISHCAITNNCSDCIRASFISSSISLPICTFSL